MKPALMRSFINGIRLPNFKLYTDEKGRNNR